MKITENLIKQIEFAQKQGIDLTSWHIVESDDDLILQDDDGGGLPPDPTHPKPPPHENQ